MGSMEIRKGDGRKGRRRERTAATERYECVLVPQIKPAACLVAVTRHGPPDQTQAPVPQFSPDVRDERDEKSGTRFEQSLIPHQIRDHQGSQQTATDAARAHTGPQGVPPPQRQVAASGVLLFAGCSLAKGVVRSLATVDVRTPARVRRPQASRVNYHRARRQMLLLKGAATMKLGGRPRL